MSRRVASNAVWNVGGALASSFVGLVALAVLVKQLGAARMGVFTLALGLIGFSGILDFGLGRALTQKLASDIGVGKARIELGALVWKTLGLLVAIGGMAGVVLWMIIPWAVHNIFHLEGPLVEESIFGLRIVALSMPFALVSTAAAGALEGLQEFRRVSTQRALLSIMQFGLPTLVSFWREDAGLAICGLAASRVIATIAWLQLLRKLLPYERGQIAKGEDYLQLLRFGGWLSISNAVGPLMVYADRFYLASIFPPASVAYYAVPVDSLFRITTLPVTAMGAVFPALAGYRSNSVKSVAMLQVSLIALIMMLLPALLLASMLSTQLLMVWLGQDFAIHASDIFRWVVLGVFVNSVAHIPYVLLQGHGRADITAKLHVLELPLFVAILVFGISRWGVVGAAIAWAARAMLDAGLLYLTAIHVHPTYASMLTRGAGLVMLCCCMLVVPLVTSDPRWFAVNAAVVIMAFTIFSRRIWRQYPREAA
ncbi:oligosaccharide flippase family protein [Solilutibacter silvestris]|uniref:oligosaccharide flippase family protein n=1 Tax=Solilutibacter silvestris TaxID=1645665 RepID=UPI003D3409C0